jgi:hypothetical protein
MSSEINWTDWISYHSTIFALNTESDLNMLTEWARLFQMAGWTPTELKQASEWLALHEPPAYRSQHLVALQKRLPYARQQKGAPPAAMDGEDCGRCVVCLGTGFVTVPNHKYANEPRGSIHHGKFYTCVVTCHCSRGRWREQHCSRDGGILSLAEYEARWPWWREEMAQHEALLKQRTRSLAHAKAVDEALGAIKARRRAANANLN